MYELLGLSVGLWLGCSAYVWWEEVGPDVGRMTPGQLLVSLILMLVFGPVIFVTRLILLSR